MVHNLTTIYYETYKYLILYTNSPRKGMKFVGRSRLNPLPNYPYYGFVFRIYQCQRNVIKKKSTPIGGGPMTVIKINRYEEHITILYTVCILYCRRYLCYIRILCFRGKSYGS